MYTQRSHSRDGGKSRGNQQGKKTARAPRSGGFSRAPSRSQSRPAHPRFGTRGRSRSFAPRVDISRFINKAVITEAVEAFVPEHRFEDFLLDARLKENIKAKGYVLPTPIQDRTIPHLLRGEDIVGIANTGTGKTAAFLLPLINKILKNKHERVLIMAPTRELALQITNELRGFSKGLGIIDAVCVGGTGLGPQINVLRRRPHFVIGTPGRLKDLLARRAFTLSEFGSVVLDEADRMLDMGFIHDMRAILSLLPAERHTLFFSATISYDVEKLIDSFLRSPVRISVKTRDTAASVEQDIVRIPAGKAKIDVLHELLSSPDFTKVLVFGRTKHGVEKIAKALTTRGIRAESIHGNKTQGARQKALDLFKRGVVQVLIATDVAARGLDIAGVSHVINFDLPASHEDYIHRIGRTGRAGKAGNAITFVE